MFHVVRHWRNYEPVLDKDEEGGEPTRSIASHQTSSRKLSFVTFLCGFVLGLLFKTLVASLYVSWPHNVAGKNKMQLAVLPTESVKFSWNQTFVDPPSNETDAAWHALIPGRGDLHGKVAIDNPERYDIEPGNQSGPHTQDYGVSMFHQLHCLISIRDVFYGLLMGKYNASDYHRPSIGEEAPELFVRVKGHTSHCFDYLRQAIQCAGDITLEGPSKNARVDIIGMGTMHHNCKSFDAARDFMHQYQPADRYDDSNGFEVPGE